MAEMVSQFRSRTWHPTTTTTSSGTWSPPSSSSIETPQPRSPWDTRRRDEKGTTMEAINEIVRRAKSEASEDERTHEVLKSIRALPGVEELAGPLAFRIGAHEIQVGLTTHLEKLEGALKEVAPLGLSIAPEVVAHLPYSDGESVLVTRYAAALGETLKPLKPADGPISAEARARAKDDLSRLAEHGMIHGYAGRGFAPWLVSGGKKTLVLEGWSALRSAGAEESREQLEKVDALFGRF